MWFVHVIRRSFLCLELSNHSLGTAVKPGARSLAISEFGHCLHVSAGGRTWGRISDFLGAGGGETLFSYHFEEGTCR